MLLKIVVKIKNSKNLLLTSCSRNKGQLARNDDDSKTLELIDCDAKMIVVSDICCAGDCTFVVERDTGCVYGCGFNSSGQVKQINL